MKLLEVFEKGEKYTTEMSSLRHERERYTAYKSISIKKNFDTSGKIKFLYYH